MKRMVSLLLSAALLTGAGLSAAATAAPVDAAYTVKAAQGVVSEEVGDVRVQVLSPTLVRIEEKGPQGFEDRSTFHVSNRSDWLGDTVTRSTEDGQVVLTTSACKLYLPQRAKDMTEVRITDLNGKRLWDYTKIQTNKVGLPDLTQYVAAWAIADTPRVVPSDWGFAAAPAGNRDNPDTNGWDFSNDAADYYVFLPAGDHKQLRKDFVNLTGRTEMLSLSALGAWDSRYYAYTEETALQQIEDFHSRDIPLDNMVIDTDWRDASNGTGYDINTKLFPNMEGFLEKAHRKNVNVIFNDHPEPTKTGEEQNNALHPAEVSFRQEKLTGLLNIGLDGWWYDRNWWTTIKPVDGFTHEVMGMATYAAAQKTVYPDRRLYMMSNVDGIHNGTRTGASNLAAHRYGVQWTGDTGGGQETIWQEVANAVEMGADSALPYVSTDLGAHQTLDASITNPEYVRWMQFGALSPIFRPHVCNVFDYNVGRMPWLRGEEVTDIYRDYLNLRYRLLPVFYQLSHENYETGMPLLRSMAFDSPEYAGADVSDQYMLGEDILVAPVIDGAGNTTVPASWFGEGLTVEYYGNKDLNGSPVLTRTEANIDSDWGDGSPNGSVPADGFSIRYTGKITIDSEQASRLSLLCDDGCRLWIDDELVIDAWKPQDSARLMTEKAFAAGSAHDFKLEYYEDTGKAKCRLTFMADGTRSALRNVWIPEGEWIDTLTGQTVYGPKTVQVVCELDEYPIYIKKGAIIPLADETLTVRDSDWSHLTLDVYPSTRQSDETQLYEDDTESTKYESGRYRTTQLTSSFDSKTQEAVVEIGAAQGGFDGPLAFDGRNWTLRVHQPAGWGPLQKATVDGKTVAFETVAADPAAMPLLTEGGSRDGAVYTLQFSSKVADAKTIRLTFQNPADPAVPADSYDTPKYYGMPVPVAVERDIQVENTVPDQVNLTAEGTADWLHTGYDKSLSTVRKAGGSGLTFRDVSTPTLMVDYKAHMSWSDGDIAPTQSGTQVGSFNKSRGDGYELIVNAGPGEQTLILYLGGWRSTALLEVFDETGGEVQRYEWKDDNGSFYRRVTIKLSADRPSPLHIRYSLVDGENNVFVAAALSGDPGQTGNALYVNPGDYQSGTWTDKTVKIGLGAGRPELVEKYQVKVNDGAWTDLPGQEYRVEEDGQFQISFRYVDTGGQAGEPQSLTVKKSGAAPQISLDTVKGEDGSFTITPALGGALSGATLYCSIDGGAWQPLADASVTLPAGCASIYRFKAVSDTGVESTVLAFSGVESAPPKPDILPGDMDGSGEVTIQDVMEACKVLARQSAGKAPTEDEMDRGDLDGDGKFTITDVMEICKILARKA